MPRLTNQQYLYRRVHLRALFMNPNRKTQGLSREATRALIEYYGVDHVLTDSEALEHRRQVQQRSPGMSVVAGRAYQRITRKRQYIRKKQHRVIAHAELNMRVDADALMRAIRAAVERENGHRHEFEP